MRHKPASTALLLCWVGLFAFFISGETRLQAATFKLQVQLLWGTSDDHSPDPKHKMVEADVKAKLKELPLKWSNYFEVNRKDFEVPASGDQQGSPEREVRDRSEEPRWGKAGSRPLWQRQGNAATHANARKGRDARAGRECSQCHRLAGRPKADGIAGALAVAQRHPSA